MYVSKETLLQKLPPFRNDRRLICDNQRTKDIIALMLDSHLQFAKFYDLIGCEFLGSTIQETCDNLYAFCKQNLQYQEESGDLQTVSVPQALLTWGKCDCKGYASFICGCLDAIKRAKKQNIDWHYCFASYNVGVKRKDRIPYHVFSVVDTANKPIWVDPTPGANGKTPVWWINKTVKTNGMALEQVIGKINTGGNGRRVGALPMQNVYTGAPPATLLKQSQLAANVLLNNVTNSTVQTAPQVTENLTPHIPTIHQPVLFNQAPVPQTQGPAAPPEAETGNSNALLYIGLGLGALYLLTASGKGNAIGGKGEKKKGSMLPLIALLGIGGYYLYTKSQDPTGTTPPPSDIIPVPTNQVPGNGQTSLPPITAPPEVVAPARAATAANDLAAMQRDWPGIGAQLNQLTDSEIIGVYNYFYGYVLPGNVLHQYPPATGSWADGGWNTQLYNQIATIRSKYGINL